MWRKLRPEFLPKTTPLNALLQQLITPISEVLLSHSLIPWQA
jgi:hypothetical protein